jgi:hypothetical protein
MQFALEEGIARDNRRFGLVLVHGDAPSQSRQREPTPAGGTAAHCLNPVTIGTLL